MDESEVYGISNQKVILKVPDKQIIVLMDMNFAWTQDQLERCKRLWQAGYGLQEIVKRMGVKGKHKEFEVFTLLYYMADKDMIESRDGFIWGKQE